MSKLLICFNTIFRSVYSHSHFGPETGMLQAHRQLSIIQGRKTGGHKDSPEKAATKTTQNICKLDNRNVFGTFTFGIENQQEVPKDPCKWLSEGSRGKSEQCGAQQAPVCSGAGNC